MSQPSGAGCLQGVGSVCTTGGHNDLLVPNTGSNGKDDAPGVYRREFGECYNQGVAFGPCAAIVNYTSSTVTVKGRWLTQSYGHEITFTGGDVQTPGSTVNLTGRVFTAGTTTILPYHAILLGP
jgi:hypothetical protein